MDRTDKILTALWLIWGAVLLIIFVSYTLFLPKLFGSEGVQAAWGWLLPNVMPPMALVAGVTYQESKKEPATVTTRAKVKTKASAPYIVISASAFYLVLLTLSVLACLTSSNPLETLRTSNLWLGPILAIATATLATRFAR